MRIAIVEDEQDLALELHALLQKLGSHSIALFPGGEQFLFAWEEQPMIWCFWIYKWRV